MGPDAGFTWMAGRLEANRNRSARISADASRVQADAAAELNRVRAALMPQEVAANVANVNMRTQAGQEEIRNVLADRVDPFSPRTADVTSRLSGANLNDEQARTQAVTQRGLLGLQGRDETAADPNQPFDYGPVPQRPVSGGFGMQSYEMRPWFSRTGGLSAPAGGGLPQITATGVTRSAPNLRGPAGQEQDRLSQLRQFQGFAKGTARVPGKGSGKVDTVPAVLAPGEAVLNKAAAEKMGRGTIAKANAAGARKMGMV
jgi:hypothetical protein